MKVFYKCTPIKESLSDWTLTLGAEPVVNIVPLEDMADYAAAMKKAGYFYTAERFVVQ